jgi:photosystem II stability/assembly factor-like uncharacterized protein
MKKSIVIILAIILAYSNSYSQLTKWFQQNSGVTDNLSTVWVIDKNTAVAASPSGTILRTTDGGNSWNKTSIEGEYWVSPRIFFINETIGWIVGNSNGIYKTTNSGANWFIVGGIENNFDLQNISFTDEINGYVVGFNGNFWITSNGGITWQQKGIPYQWYTRIKFIDQNNGYAVGHNSTIIKTTDKGENWLGCGYPYNYYDYPSDISSINGNKIWITGWVSNPTPYCYVKYTSDGGTNWITLLTSSSIGYIQVLMDNENDGWINGISKIFRTTNGGTDWIEEYTAKVGYNLSAMQVINNEYGWAVGENGTIIKYLNFSLSTSSITNINFNSALSGGNIIDDGGNAITARGVCWSLSQNPTITDSKTNEGTGIGSFSSSITGLNPNTKYYVRAYATNSLGTAYGNQDSLTTSASIPILSTTSISNITSTSATSGGNITSDGGATVTARGVCWSICQNPTTANNKTTDGTGTGSFTRNITGLIPNTTYYVRAYATNSVGTAYGDEKSFTTQHFQISLSQGWNMIAYLQYSELNCETVFAGIADNIVIVKDNFGNVYIPSYGINTIGNLVPGQGYQIYVTNPDVLVYPGN